MGKRGKKPELKNPKWITFQISEDEYKEFTEKARKSGLTRSDILRELVKDYIQGKIS